MKLPYCHGTQFQKDFWAHSNRFLPLSPRSAIQATDIQELNYLGSQQNFGQKARVGPMHSFWFVTSLTSRNVETGIISLIFFTIENYTLRAPKLGTFNS